MEYEVVKKWLDELVKDFMAATKESTLNSGIRAVASVDRNVLIYEGLDVVADVMGLKVSEEPFNNAGETWYIYSFAYQGVLFSTYQSKRLPGYGE